MTGILIVILVVIGSVLALSQTLLASGGSSTEAFNDKKFRNAVMSKGLVPQFIRMKCEAGAEDAGNGTYASMGCNTAIWATAWLSNPTWGVNAGIVPGGSHEFDFPASEGGITRYFVYPVKTTYADGSVWPLSDMGPSILVFEVVQNASNQQITPLTYPSRLEALQKDGFSAPMTGSIVVQKPDWSGYDEYTNIRFVYKRI